MRVQSGAATERSVGGAMSLPAAASERRREEVGTERVRERERAMTRMTTARDETVRGSDEKARDCAYDCCRYVSPSPSHPRRGADRVVHSRVSAQTVPSD